MSKKAPLPASTSNVAKRRMPANRHSKAHRNCRIKIFRRSSAWKHLQVVDTNLTIFPPSLMSMCLISFEEFGSALSFFRPDWSVFICATEIFCTRTPKPPWVNAT
jgi:hypothetical protein